MRQSYHGLMIFLLFTTMILLGSYYFLVRHISTSKLPRTEVISTTKINLLTLPTQGWHFLEIWRKIPWVLYAWMKLDSMQCLNFFDKIKGTYNSFDNFKLFRVTWILFHTLDKLISQDGKNIMGFIRFLPLFRLDVLKPHKVARSGLMTCVVVWEMWRNRLLVFVCTSIVHLDRTRLGKRNVWKEKVCV